MGIIDASNLISTLISNGEIDGVLGNLSTTNIQGETQKKLDVLSNDIFIEALLKNNLVLLPHLFEWTCKSLLN